MTPSSGLLGCDKSLPGMMMAMIRLNTPSVFIYGGSILPGRLNGKDVTVQDVFEAVGQHQAGNMSDEELTILERVACPSAGACGGQFTANTMACVSEAIGLALPNSSGAPAPYESRDQYSEASGVAVMNLIEKNIRARDIVTLKSLQNAARVVACTGGSTNAGLHLPAMAHEAGIDFDLDDVCDIFRDTPYFVDLKPGGQYVAKDLYEAGGVPVVMKELRKAGLIHEDCMTVTGRSIGEEIDLVEREADGKVIYPVRNADHQDRRRGWPQGQPRPRKRHREGRGHVPGRTGLHRPGARLRMRRGCLRGGQGAQLQGRRSAGDPQRRPRRWPRHARNAGHHRRPVRSGHGQEGGADHRWPLLGRHPRFLRRPCRARGRAGRTHRAVEGRRRDHHRRDQGRDFGRSDATRNLANRKKAWKGPRETLYASGALWKYAQLVGPTNKGAVTHPGAKAERHVYMDL